MTLITQERNVASLTFCLRDQGYHNLVRCDAWQNIKNVN